MTSYTFSPSNTNVFQNWDSAPIWSPASVPNGSAATVSLPEIFNSSTGAQVTYQVQIQAGESYTISAANIAALVAWGAHLDEVVTGKPAQSNVHEFRKQPA